ncbi:hypothetical protein GCM10027174_25450 [Salinifilum aidingensis]
MYVTYPLAIAADEVWLFVEYDGITEIEAYRLGISPRTGDYTAFPTDQFHADGIVPVCRAHGEPVDDHVWATVTDLEANPVFPGHRATERPE